MTTPDEDFFDYRKVTDRFYRERVAKVSKGLRELADQIDRDGLPYTSAGVDGSPRYADAAQRALHALTWGIANIGVDRLVTEAAQADNAERKDQP